MSTTGREGMRVRQVYAIGRGPKQERYGTVLHDSHGVEAYVRWDNGARTLETWSSLDPLEGTEPR